MRAPNIVVQFYKPLIFVNALFSLAGFYDLWLNGSGQLVGSLFVKSAGYLVSIGFQYYSVANTYYYYRNAGYSVRKLYIRACLLDLFIYLSIITVYSIITAIGC